MLLAVVSSFRDRPLPRELVAFGEVGLAGEIRPVPGGQERLHEAARHGFRRCTRLLRLAAPAVLRPPRLFNWSGDRL